MESALWFLPCLFFVSLIYLGIDFLIRNEKFKLIIIVILTIIGCCWTNYIYVYLPWGINSALSALGFYYVGNFYRKNESYINNKFSFLYKPGFIIIATLFGSALVYLNQTLNMRAGVWGIIPITYMNAIIFSWTCNVVVLQMSKIKICRNILLPIGANSIVYLCINHPAIALSNVIIEKFISVVDGGIKTVLVFIMAMTVMYIITQMITKTKLKLIIGKV